MSGFDWPALMRAGVQELRLRPDEFWHLTPAELRLMLGQGGASSALSRTGLGALLEAYPDRQRGECDE